MCRDWDRCVDIIRSTFERLLFLISEIRLQEYIMYILVDERIHHLIVVRHVSLYYDERIRLRKNKDSFFLKHSIFIRDLLRYHEDKFESR